MVRFAMTDEMAYVSRNLNKQNMKSDKTVLDIKRFPEVVKIHICKFLDVSSLMNLRLTCKDLNSIVEQASVLQNLPIKVLSSKQLQRILESTVPFNNFILKFKCLEEQTYLNDFAIKYGPCIRKLCIVTRGGHEKTLNLLLKCTQLKELEIQTVSTNSYLNYSNLEIVFRNLRGLSDLTIHELGGENETDGHNDIDFFLRILQNCRNLVRFKIPAIASYNQKLLSRQCKGVNEQEASPDDNMGEEDWEEEIELDAFDPLPRWDNNRDILIHPILDFIQWKLKTGLPQIKCIDIQSVSLFEAKTVKDLFYVCCENGIRLFGIKSSQFSYITENDLANLKYNDMIKSAILTDIRHECLLNMFNDLRELNVLINPLSNFPALREDSNLALPHLQDLRTQFMFSVNGCKNQLLIKKLFKESKRPTVERLQIEWLLDEYCPTIKAVDLVNNFRSIKELTIIAWDAVDSEFCLLWTNLLGLEKLTIKDCKNLTNRGFVGHFNLNDDRNMVLRPFNHLKKLRSLTIRDISGNVNDVALLGSFRWMKLRYLEFESTMISVIREEVYRSLISSPMGKSIEYLIVPTPYSKSEFFDKRVLMKGFTNLKRRASW